MAIYKTQSFWQVSLSNANDRLLHMLRSTDFIDCEFKVQDRTFAVHKNILAMSSPVFETMFFGSIPHDPSKPIEISDIDGEIFEMLLNYIYGNYSKLDSIANAQNLIYAARKYMLNHLEQLCVDDIVDMINESNACEIYDIAQRFNNNTLKQKCLTLFIENTSEILNRCKFENIYIDTLLVILDQPFLAIESELELFNAIEKYAKAHGIENNHRSLRSKNILVENVKGFDAKADNGGKPEVSTQTEVENTKGLDSKVVNGEKPEDSTHTEVEDTRGLNSKADNSEKSEDSTYIQVVNTKGFDAKTDNGEKPENSNDDEGNFDIEKKYVEELKIFEALKKIRFLTMTHEEFASGPASSNLLLPYESLPILMDIDTKTTKRLPYGFSNITHKRSQ